MEQAICADVGNTCVRLSRGADGAGGCFPTDPLPVRCPDASAGMPLAVVTASAPKLDD